MEADTFRVLEDFEEGRLEELHHFFTMEEALQLLAQFSRIGVEPLVGGERVNSIIVGR